MATGDNTFTGVAVGREWDIITCDELFVANMEKFATEITFERVIESKLSKSNSRKLTDDIVELEDNKIDNENDENAHLIGMINFINS